jgi:hypothetical protein
VNFTSWETPLPKTMYSNNSHTLDAPVHNICERITFIENSELNLVQYNLFERTEVCLRAEGRFFEHLFIMCGILVVTLRFLKRSDNSSHWEKLCTSSKFL